MTSTNVGLFLRKLCLLSVLSFQLATLGSQVAIYIVTIVGSTDNH